MIRMKPVGNGERGERAARRADLYYEHSDAGYYRDEGGLRSEWVGQGAEKLALEGTPDYEQFKRLIRGLDPHSGERLTARLVDDRIPAWDVTASVPKGVTSALERGDERIQNAIWASVREAFALMEGYATCRVRTGGRQEDRVTGNLVGYAVEHADTRPVEDASLPEGHPWRLMPDWDRHIHVVVANVTWDDVEERWKAVKFRPIMELRKYFDRCFDAILAAKLTGELGYEVETKWQPGGKYYSWDITGIPETVIAKNSRRSAEIDQAEAGIIAELKEEARLAGDPEWERIPDRLSAVVRDMLGATSRHDKREGLTLADCRAYWESRITPEEAKAIEAAIERARNGSNPPPEPAAAAAVDFAMRHHFEQAAALTVEQLVTTALEHAMGASRPCDIERELERQGVIIVRDAGGQRLATLPELAREEEWLSGYAAAGIGSLRAAGVAEGLERGKLNDGQWAVVTGLLESENRIDLVQGPAGAGKSSMLSTFDTGMALAGRDVTYLATTAKAAGVLNKEGFEAHTLAHFLLDERMQQAARGGCVVIDEASMLGHADAVRLFRLAERHDLRLVFVGDPMQHGSVGRGAFMRLLTDYAGLRPFKLHKIMRQENPEYRAAAHLLSEGRTVEGFEALDTGLGWVKEVASDEERCRQIAGEYVRAMEELRDLPEHERALVVSPTHAEAEIITREIRQQLKEAGRLDADEREISRLVQADASEAEKGLRQTYRPGDVLVYHQNAAGGVRKGTRITVTDPEAVPVSQAARFSLYRREAMALAAGETIRFTGRVEAMGGGHTYKNGDTAIFAGWTPGGHLRLDDGRVIRADAGHLRHGYVETSFGSQGRTVRRAIVAVASPSLPAANQEMAYVASSRARESMTLYTDDKEALIESIRRSSQQLLALDLKRKSPDWLREHLERKRRQAACERRVPAATERRAKPAERVRQHLDRQRRRANTLRLQATAPAAGSPRQAGMSERVRRHLEQKRRTAAGERLRKADAAARPYRPAVVPAAPASHVGRHQARQQQRERGQDHGR